MNVKNFAVIKNVAIKSFHCISFKNMSMDQHAIKPVSCVYLSVPDLNY